MLSAVTFWHLDGGWTIPTVPPLASDRLVGSIMGNTGTGPIVRMEHFFATACLSASFGMQGVMARRLNTFFGNTGEGRHFLFCVHILTFVPQLSSQVYLWTLSLNPRCSK